MQKRTGEKTPKLKESHELDKRCMILTPNNWRRTWVISKEIPLEDDIFTGDKMYKSGKCIKEIWENIWEILKNNCRKEKVYLFKGINKELWKLWINKGIWM